MMPLFFTIFAITIQSSYDRESKDAIGTVLPGIQVRLLEDLQNEPILTIFVY